MVLRSSSIQMTSYQFTESTKTIQYDVSDSNLCIYYANNKMQEKKEERTKKKGGGVA